MPDIAVAPFIMADVLLTLGTDNYQTHVSTAELAPQDNSPVTWKGLAPSSVFSFGKKATWVCNLTYAQDWETDDSLSRYLFDNEGEEVAAVFEPVNGGSSFTATLIITPGAVGGAVDSVATAQVTLGVKGKPVFAEAV